MKWLLLLWGTICLIGCAFLAYSATLGNRAKRDAVTKKDVRFVLNHCGLGAERIEEVLHSYQSSRAFTGDHEDLYAIRISHVTVQELEVSQTAGNLRWYRGDSLPEIVDKAVSFAGSTHASDTSWFPTEPEIRSSEMYVFCWRVDFVGTNPSNAQLIFARPRDRMIFYYSGSI
jgi:hypothetical protein